MTSHRIRLVLLGDLNREDFLPDRQDSTLSIDTVAMDELDRVLRTLDHEEFFFFLVNPSLSEDQFASLYSKLLSLPQISRLAVLLVVSERETRFPRGCVPPEGLPFDLVTLPTSEEILQAKVRRLRHPDEIEHRLLREIAERTKVEAALRKHHDLLEAFVTRTPAAVAMFDKDLRYLLTSQRWLKDYRLEGQDLRGRHHYDVFPEIRSMPRWMEIHQRCLAGASEKCEEDRFERADGVESWIRWEILPWHESSGEVGGILMLTEVITERKKAAIERDRFFHLSQDLLCTAGMDGYFKWINPSFHRVLGWSEEELLGRPFIDWVLPDDRKATIQVLEMIGQGIPTLKFENRYRCKDGSICWLQWMTTPLLEEGLLYAVARDVTAQKEAEERERLLEAQMLQAQKLESLGVLAGGIAHDFNNLLMAILGNVDLVLSDMSPVSPFRDNLQEVERASKRAAELCRQMLAYSGRGQFVIEALDLNEVVREVGHMLEVSISKKAILKYNFSHNLPAIDADPTQIRQIIMNLIVNASEAIGETSGIISITTGAMDCDRRYFSGLLLDGDLPEGTYSYLEVADTGCGMTAEVRERIFDPFFTTKFTGRGLGLAAVLGIIRGHRGALKVYSEPGKGSTFKVLFPAVAEDTRSSRETGPKPVAWKASGKILLVDDEETVRVVGRKMLEKVGFEVLLASDGNEALEVFKVRQGEILAILLDLTMPQMDGETAYRELRRLSPKVPIILSSGYNEQEVTQRFVGKGLDGFIQKPYTAHDLIQKIREFVPGVDATGKTS